MSSLKLHKSKWPCNSVCFKNYTTITMLSQLKISALEMYLWYHPQVQELPNIYTQI